MQPWNPDPVADPRCRCPLHELGLKLDPRGRDSSTFSSCNSVVGPFAQFPVPLEGDDVSELPAATTSPAW